MTNSVLKALTESDDLTYDFVRIGGAVAVLGAGCSVIVYLGLTITAFFSDTYTFDGQAFGTGFAALLAGLGTFLVMMAGALRWKPDSGGDLPS
jgi:hypothetical protein